MEEAVARVERLRNFFRDNPLGAPGEGSADKQRGGSGEPPSAHGPARREAFRDALADDFNTPKALAEVFELVGEANRGEVMGRRQLRRSRRCWSSSVSAPLPSQIRVLRATSEAPKLMQEREEARAAKDFARADELRDQLAELGWTVRDSAEGPSLGPRRPDGEPVHLWASTRLPRRSGGGGGCIGSGGRRRPRRRSWSGSAGRRTTRGWSPRSIPIPTAIRGGCCGEGAAAGRARPGPGPAQPRRRLPLGRVRRRRRRSHPRAPLGRDHPGRPARPPPAPSSTSK